MNPRIDYRRNESNRILYFLMIHKRIIDYFTPKVRLTPSRTKRIDPDFVAFALGAEEVNMKQAGVMLIIKDGLILGITRRTDKTKYGLPGGKFNPESPDLDRDTKDTAIRETHEETGLEVFDCIQVFHRVELGDGPDGIDFHSYCYYATNWEGEPRDSEEGQVEWLTAEEITSTKAAFGDYNKKTLDVFKLMFPSVYIKGE